MALNMRVKWLPEGGVGGAQIVGQGLKYAREMVA
jgi:hypothetical protein